MRRICNSHRIPSTFLVHKMVQILVKALVLLLLQDVALAVQTCHKCEGINCQRTSYAAIEECVDTLDTCVTVFQGQMVLAQGCLGQISQEIRAKCDTPSVADGVDENDENGSDLESAECQRCNEDLCNNMSANEFECIQCDSTQDTNCGSNPDALSPQRCPIARTLNSYCYAQIDGHHLVRGCTTNLAQQLECIDNENCHLCSPLEIIGCNNQPRLNSTDGSGSGDGESGSGDGGSGSGSGSGQGGSGSGDGGSGSGSGSGDGGSGSGSGSGDGGSGSGSGSGDGGSGSGSGSGSGDGGSGSGSGSGSGDGGSGSGSGSGDGGSGNGSGSGSGDGGSGSGSGSGSGDGESGSGSGSGDGGSGSGSGSGSGDGGSDSGSGDGSGGGNNRATGRFSSALFATILSVLMYFNLR